MDNCLDCWIIQISKIFLCFIYKKYSREDRVSFVERDSIYLKFV